MKKINEIIIEGTIYPRTRFDSDTVERYTEAMAAGAKFPPLVITPDGRLLDGRHRYEAYKQVGKAEVEVAIEDPVDPAVRAVELNLQHGKPLTRAEMRELARKWYGARPVTEIASILGVARQTVQNWVSDLAAEREEAREEIREKALEMRAGGKTQEEVAGELGVTRQAVSKWEGNSVKNLTLLRQDEGNETECSGAKNLTHGSTESISSDSEVDEEDITDDEGPIDIDPPDCEEKPLEDYGGREAAEAFRKKHLECSDQVKEFFNQVKKASEISEQLVNNREKLYRSIVEMEGDGISIAVLASATVQACDIYVPRMTAARDMLSGLLEKKGVTPKDKFLVLNGGKQNGN